MIIAALALALTACVNELQVDNKTDESMFTISLVNNSGGETRAAGEDRYNENFIGKIDIFFFDNTGAQLCYPEQSQISYTSDKVVMSIPSQTAAALFNKPITLYMFANCPLLRTELAGKSLLEVQSLVLQNAATLNPTPFVSQSSFLMEGGVQIPAFTEDNTDLGSITLKRAAAKVIVKIVEAQVDGYTATEAAVSIANYLDKTALSTYGFTYSPTSSDFKDSAYRPLRLPASGVQYDSEPLYSYSHDWANHPAHESYASIRLKWRHNASGIETYAYYRIPFDYTLAEQGAETNHSLKRNHIYTFRVTINALGGDIPSKAIDLDLNFDLRDWTTYEIKSELNQYDFLVVAEKFVEMHDIPLRVIQYASSRPVTINIDSAYYFRYESNGDINKINLSKEADGLYYPRITTTAAGNEIAVYSKVPINYVPTYIQFTVANGALTQTVRVVQYPRQYLTSAFSDKNDIDFNYYNQIGQSGFWNNGGNGSTGMTNFNLYTITTTAMAAEDDFVLGGGMIGTVATKPFGSRQGTKTDEETNRMVSPKFVVASQRGVVKPDTYSGAVIRCALYSEGGYPIGTWRVPTLAEMALISKLQNDPNSALKDLFVPASSDTGRWWTARREGDGSPGTVYYAYHMRLGQVETTTDSSQARSVRCVHDVWKDE